MLKQNFPIFLVIAVVSLSTSCATNRINPSIYGEITELKTAACSAEKFLKKNGYLTELAYSDVAIDSLSLELWDKLNYKTGDVFDWSTMLKDRANTFSNRLYGVASVENNRYLVYYQFSDQFRCVSVDEKMENLHVHEANCLNDDQVVRVNRAELDCKD